MDWLAPLQDLRDSTFPVGASTFPVGAVVVFVSLFITNNHNNVLYVYWAVHYCFEAGPSHKHHVLLRVTGGCQRQGSPRDVIPLEHIMCSPGVFIPLQSLFEPVL